MTSIIQLFKKNGLNFTAHASSYNSENVNPYKVFDDNRDWFETKSEEPGQWWQVSFSKAVTVASYTIKTGSSYSNRPNSWEVKTSMNNETFETVNTMTKDIGDNTEKFPLDKVVSCKHFRIIFKSGVDHGNEKHFSFTFFDCFGTIAKVNKNGNSCKNRNRYANMHFILYFSLIHISY